METVQDLIDELVKYNPDAKVKVITNHQPHNFELTFGSSEGVTKETCEVVGIYVEQTNKTEVHESIH
ncbi:MAG: hypothetical protein PQJ49_01805 [Sphaerochaetaceae bacterium]|nr:hypothetical protein [Sphaerochaetaceae bacterium]